MEFFKQNITQIKEGLMELENLFKEGKDRNDAKVKDTEDKIRTALDVPRNSWMKSDETLRDVIETLNKQLSIVQNATIPHEMIPDKDVLKNASGGLALEGVFKTRNPEDLLVKKEQLIEIPDSFTLRSPVQSSMYEQKQFSSHTSERNFHKAVEILGYSFSHSLSTELIGSSLGFVAEKNKFSETEETNKSLQAESYILHTKYNCIPLASGFLQKDELKLSTGALNALKIIETVSLHSDDRKTLTKQLRYFFKTFGSHVNQGTLHFGAIFWWRAFTSGFKTNDLLEVKQLTTESLNVYCSAKYGFGAQSTLGKAGITSLELRGFLTGKHREDLMSQVHLSVSKTGGPPDIDDFFLWKSHLAANNRTWSVIDRGTTLIPVWEILIDSHRHDFKDVFNLSKILMEAYKEITGENVEEVLGEDILFEAEKAETLIKEVKSWTITDCESNMRQLLAFKNSLFEKTVSHRLWVQKCLSSEILQNYLSEVTTASCNSTETLRVLMRSLLEHDPYKVGNWQNRGKIMNWAYQSEDELDEQVSVLNFSELDRIFGCTKKEMDDSRHAFSSSDQEENTRKKATNTVTHALNSFSKMLRDNDQVEAELLILSITTVIGFSRCNKTFNHVLSTNEIAFLQSALNNAFNRYSSLREQCPIKAQAHLLLTALTVSTNKDTAISPVEKEERLQLLLTELKVSRTIQSVIEKNNNDWESLESALHDNIIMETEMNNRSPTTEEALCQLQNILMREVAHFTEVQQMDKQTAWVCHKGERCRRFMDLLQRLGLQNYFPQRMTKASVLAIDKLSLSLKEPQTEEDLSSHYLYKLMMLDYSARYLFVKPEAIHVNIKEDVVNYANEADVFFNFDDNSASVSSEHKQNLSVEVSAGHKGIPLPFQTCHQSAAREGTNMSVEAEEGFCNCDDKSDMVVSSKQTHIHPMDVQMAVFHCSSDFLRQYIYAKLSDCQLSLPFLVPNPYTDEIEFPVWALRHIRKSWKWKSGIYQTRQMFNTSVPVVSFFRLGISKLNSKSQILNGIISKQKHDVFFHRHCEGSTPDSLLMNGVVEIAWYCPGGKEDDVFDDCVAFLNLHGDAAEHPKQLDFLQAVSTVNVLLLSELPMSEKGREICKTLFHSHVPLICLFSGRDKINQLNKSTKVGIVAKNRNQTEFRKELISSIKQCINENQKTVSIEMCCEEARKHEFVVDADKQSCNAGYAEAQKLIDHLKAAKLLNVKEKVLPLQGQLWHEWCKKNKEQYRLQSKENENIEKQLSKFSFEMTKIRQAQLGKVTPLNFIRLFLECLTSTAQFENMHLYMVQWFIILLKELTTVDLESLEKDYRLTWRKIKNVRKDKAPALQNRLDNISDKIASSIVGFQHIMRELSQLYESIQNCPQAVHTVTNVKTGESTLPKIAVELVIAGFPLELMDGDAAHVPLVWINAVLDELIKTLGDKKIFVLSILGLQSSGKSTLLNTMFGVQFAVGAGRCTRGAFMQLLELDPSIRNELGYDFVLVVDTQGLRSPELSTKIPLNHDNELATFIIGIGDVTVINIMGENPAEMQDILQICVQAFLRMKQVKIMPSCIFVHQNVAESSAGDKNFEGRRHLLEKLDEIVENAAKEENVEGVTCFSDVIQFDIETQVFYFKNLLEGDPPMAPVNPSYSQNVQQLKTKLLTVAKWQETCQFSSLSEFKCRVSDLWTALLQENFVFSFKNTVEIMVYSSLEDKYGEWSWKLRQQSLTLQAKLENQIGSNLIQEVTLANLTEEFDKVYNPLQTEMEKHFSEDKNKDMLIKWEANTKLYLTGLKKELIDGILKKCDEQRTAKQKRSELDQKKARYINQLMEQSKRLASKLKNQDLTEDTMIEEFDKLWINWTTEVMRKQPTEKSLNVKGVVECILCNQFWNQPNIKKKVKEGKFKFNPKTHIQQNACNWLDGTGLLIDDKIQELRENVVHAVNEYITDNENGKKDFDENFIYKILKDVRKSIDDFECIPENPKFSKEFRMDFSVNICLMNVGRLQKMHEDFRTANHPLTYLQSQRETYFQCFKNYCKGANSVTTFVDFLCKSITQAVLNATNNKTCQQIADRLKSNNPALSGNRSNVENHILKYLAEKEDLNLYSGYLFHPEMCFKRFIQEQVMQFCSDDNKLPAIHQENLKSLRNNLLMASTEVTTEVSEKKGNASLWLELFCEKVGELIVIKRDELCSIENEVISDWQFLKDTMARSLEEMIKDVKMDVEGLREEPTKILFQQLQGCWAQCPFCGAICTNTIPNHDGDHSVRFHRSKALKGLSWNGTNHFVIDFCTTAVISDANFRSRNMEKWIPYKTYRSAGDPYNKWSITGDGSSQCYWKWFICKFRSQWEEKYCHKFTGKGQIPPEWETFKKEDALKELQ